MQGLTNDMKLEIKHLAPYLPYKLNIMSEAHPGSKEPNIFQMKGIDVEVQRIIGENGVFAEFKNGFCKPILRPLSELKDYKIIGFENRRPGNEYDHAIYLHSRGKSVLACEYEMVEILLKWHFDIFGLIPKGLAIDINTIGQ